MIVSLIAAMTPAGVIGVASDLPWHLPADLAWFKAKTLAKPVIMGHTTWRSLPFPLPKRRNLVLSRAKNLQLDGAEVYSDLPAALAEVQGAEEVMIIGGATIYQQALPLANRLYITLVDAELDGDAFFPEVNWADWQQTHEHTGEIDERNIYAQTYRIYQRKD